MRCFELKNFKIKVSGVCKTLKCYGYDDDYDYEYDEDYDFD